MIHFHLVDYTIYLKLWVKRGYSCSAHGLTLPFKTDGVQPQNAPLIFQSTHNVRKLRFSTLQDALSMLFFLIEMMSLGSVEKVLQKYIEQCSREHG